jgi:hypothetical protein
VLEFNLDEECENVFFCGKVEAFRINVLPPSSG